MGLHERGTERGDHAGEGVQETVAGEVLAGGAASGEKRRRVGNRWNEWERIGNSETGEEGGGFGKHGPEMEFVGREWALVDGDIGECHPCGRRGSRVWRCAGGGSGCGGVGDDGAEVFVVGSAEGAIGKAAEEVEGEFEIGDGADVFGCREGARENVGANLRLVVGWRGARRNEGWAGSGHGGAMVHACFV